MVPKVVRPEEARRIALYDVGFADGIGADDTAGGVSMLEVTIPPLVPQPSGRGCSSSTTSQCASSSSNRSRSCAA